QTIGASGYGGGFFLAPARGYINMDTLEWLEYPATFSELYVTIAGDGNQMALIEEVANRVHHEVENSGRVVTNKVTSRSTDHPNSTYVDAISTVLFLLGLLVVFLSGFLITNTLSALMNQQVQQVGVMKTLGAQRAQIMGIYMMLIFIFGLLAFAIALPLSGQFSFYLLEFLAQKVNFSLFGYRVVPWAAALQLVIALVVPQVSGFIPILRGSGLTVQEATSGFSQGQGVIQKSWIDTKFIRQRVRSRPLLISLRNTFRRKGRLALTLITLSLGGSIFIATLNVQVSLTRYIEQISRYFLADVNLSLNHPYRIDKIRSELAGVPGVALVEGWGYARTELVLEDGSVGDSLRLLAPPAGSRLVEPVMLSGRWVKPGDQNAIVLSERFFSRFPGMRLGDTLRLKVNGKESDWVVVGFFQLAGKSGGFLVYAPYDYLARLTNQTGQAATYRIVSTDKSLTLDGQKELGQRIETHLKDAGIQVSDVTAGAFLHTSAAKGLNILTIFLLIMAILTALVGSIGLMGTMSLNVMERTREIGILRAIGASNRILMRLVMVEGLLIGLFSWLLGSLLAFPISKLMSDRVSMAIFDAPSRFTFSANAFLIWLGVVLALSAMASIIPARNAARLTIREVLAYE
ncbi:MAG: FtsX-like permease family protein, partial [Chloroflexota bacterium]